MFGPKSFLSKMDFGIQMQAITFMEKILTAGDFYLDAQVLGMCF